MPGTSFPLDAFECITGSKLREVKGTSCASCYAIRIQKFRPNVNKAWNLNSSKARHWITTDPNKWIESMVFQISREAEKTKVYYHRWFDSGDLQGLQMLEAINEVCVQTPDVSHWLPTQERHILKQFTEGFSPNLVIRVSAVMVDDTKLPTFGNTSSVHTKGKTYIGHECPASNQDNQCKSCRSCWNGLVPNVSYPKH